MVDDPFQACEETPLDGTDLFADVSEQFIEPEIARRRADGSFGADERVLRYQVLLPPGEPAVVRLNDQVRGEILVEVSREMQVGDDVYLEDVERVAGFEPSPEDRGIPYIAAFAHRTGW